MPTQKTNTNVPANVPQAAAQPRSARQSGGKGTKADEKSTGALPTAAAATRPTALSRPGLCRRKERGKESVKKTLGRKVSLCVLYVSGL